MLFNCAQDDCQRGYLWISHYGSIRLVNMMRRKGQLGVMSNIIPTLDELVLRILPVEAVNVINHFTIVIQLNIFGKF